MISKYSIAVLPFVNISSDPENEYFSDGITEEIINALSKINDLHVTARTSAFVFKNQSVDIREVGKKLNVALVLEGSVRKSESKIRITAQLTRTDNGFHVWSETWDRMLKDIFILQDEIAGLISGKVNSNIEHPEPPHQHVVKDTAAIDAYLRGNHILSTWDFSRAKELIELFKEAIRLDPELIQAYIGLVNASTWLGSTGYLSKEETQRNIENAMLSMLELDPNCADIYSLNASRDFWINWDIRSAMKNIDKALELRPGATDNLVSKGLILASCGNVEEALDHLFQADRLDPYSSNIKSGIGMVYYYTGEDAKALEYIDQNIRIAPYWDAQYMFKVEALCKLKRFEEAWRTIEMVESNPRSGLSIAGLKAYYFASSGQNESALGQIRIMESEGRSQQGFNDPEAAFFAQIFLLLGDKKESLRYFVRGMSERSAPLLFHKLNTAWDDIRNEPEYIRATEAIQYPGLKDLIPAKKNKYARSMLTSEDAQLLIKALDLQMNKQKPWLNPTLNLSDLAELIDVSTHTLSQLLNEFLGQNFYDYVNKYRLNYLLEVHDKPEFRNFKLLSLAYECGFNSKTTFNSFFRKTIHTTPSDYFKMRK
ncbi:MAG: helix-turn-helix domain-containing protein [Bacteroidales bacterium]|nr:helix-turn-helix domain-containing protein [Bacteroidales bacterium]